MSEGGEGDVGRDMGGEGDGRARGCGVQAGWGRKQHGSGRAWGGSGCAEAAGGEARPRLTPLPPVLSQQTPAAAASGSRARRASEVCQPGSQPGPAERRRNVLQRRAAPAPLAA